ncbi:TetR/AcrR family transcriptional regulator [Pseudonocardia sp. NPDC049154]|uniref:TetR/AcrR family transcriptional regulator n=1 Tax=Pseudonocardia sp. NPDC049154 TaxID=3155501 RepID=UPI00340C40C1
MAEETVVNRVQRRRAATVEEILEAAWVLAAQDGLAGLSLRHLAGRLQMRPQSLAWYFPSKNSLYDALYARGHEDFRRRLAEAGPLDVPSAARSFAAFCVENPPRYQLMTQRTVPGFVPSDSAAALARETFGAWRRALQRAGVNDRAHVDVLTALVKGLVDQQITVDPTGDRYLRHLEFVIDMFTRAVASHPPIGAA